MSTFDPAHDYLPEAGLAAAEALVARVPQDFTMDVDATQKTLTMRLRFTRPLSALERADSAEPLIHAAMLLDTLCKNLRHERATRASVDREALVDAIEVALRGRYPITNDMLIRSDAEYLAAAVAPLLGSPGADA